MVVVIPTAAAAAASAANAATVASLFRMKKDGALRNGSEKPSKEKKRKEPSAFIKERFEKAWKRQEDRLSKLKTKFNPEASFEVDEGAFCICHNVYEYENGRLAVEEDSSAYSSAEYLYDESGNCILERRHEDGVEIFSRRCVYYPDSKQKEFEWTDDGIRHFDKDGVENTKFYLAKQKIAAKRIREEVKTGETFKKMGKLEKAVATVLQDTKEMTLIEKMMAQKVKKSGR